MVFKNIIHLGEVFDALFPHTFTKARIIFALVSTKNERSFWDRPKLIGETDTFRLFREAFKIGVVVQNCVQRLKRLHDG